jgi:hypothetical protein
MQAVWIRAAALAAVCLCGTAAPGAQQADTPAAATGVIAGRVVDASDGHPLPGVSVTMSGGPPAGRREPPRVLTDSQGRFIFVRLAAGNYRPDAQRVGYSQPAVIWNRRVPLAVGERVTDVTIRLHRLASISGTVTDDQGDAAVGVGVVAYRRAILNGHVTSFGTNEARTDDRGEYRLTNLQAGEYLVCACRHDPIPFDGVLLATLASDPMQLLGVASRALKVGADVASIDGVRTFAPAFHPAAALMSRATPIVVGDGDHRQNNGIQVTVVRAARISGTVVGAPGDVVASQIRLRPAGDGPDSPMTIEPTLVQPNGRFDFAGMPSGTYVINVSMPALPQSGAGPTGAALALLGRAASGISPRVGGASQRPDPPFWGETTVTVGDADVTGVIVALRPAASVTVTIDLPPLPPPVQGQPIPVRGVQFVSLRPDTRGVPPFGRLQPDGTYLVPGLAPGLYSVTPNAAPGFRIDRVTLHGEDITDLPFEMGDTSVTDLVATFVNGPGAKISGTVTGEIADICVLVFPANRRFWAEPGAALRRFETIPVPRTGTFSTNQPLPAGDYLVIAVPDSQAVDWQWPSQLEALALQAQKVTVAAGEAKVIEVKK